RLTPTTWRSSRPRARTKAATTTSSAPPAPAPVTGSRIGGTGARRRGPDDWGSCLRSRHRSDADHPDAALTAVGASDIDVVSGARSEERSACFGRDGDSLSRILGTYPRGQL